MFLECVVKKSDDPAMLIRSFPEKNQVEDLLAQMVKEQPWRRKGASLVMLGQHHVFHCQPCQRCIKPEKISTREACDHLEIQDWTSIQEHLDSTGEGLHLYLLVVGLMRNVFGTQTVETKSMSVIEGDAVTLPTDLSEIQNDDTILWMFGPEDFLISQIKRQDNFTSFFVTDDEKFRGRLQVDQNTGSLTIRNTRIRHSGLYKLTVSKEKITFKVFIVTVLAVVGETDGVKLLPVSVLEGNPLTLHTDSKIHQDALMLWRFGDKGILLAKIDTETKETSLNNADERFRDRLQVDQTGSLTIKNTRTTDSGLYELQIRGSESSQRFLVSVR
ncbi:hypothetical protein QQF64_034577, partial [Cirrhinus molitorella]